MPHNRSPKRRFALIVRLEQDAGVLRLVFEDAEMSPSGSASRIGLFTYREYDREGFLDLRLSKKELAHLGFLLAARLGGDIRVFGPRETRPAKKRAKPLPVRDKKRRT